MRGFGTMNYGGPKNKIHGERLEDLITAIRLQRAIVGGAHGYRNQINEYHDDAMVALVPIMQNCAAFKNKFGKLPVEAEALHKAWEILRSGHAPKAVGGAAKAAPKKGKGTGKNVAISGNADKEKAAGAGGGNGNSNGKVGLGGILNDGEIPDISYGSGVDDDGQQWYDREAWHPYPHLSWAKQMYNKDPLAHDKLMAGPIPMPPGIGEGPFGHVRGYSSNPLPEEAVDPKPHGHFGGFEGMHTPLPPR